MADRISDIAFTDSVKAQQSLRGSREHLASGEDWLDHVTPELAKFIAARTSFYFSSVSETGYPYIQHRGGPPGFLKVLDDRTLGFGDFAGNRQYISLGNMDSSDRVNLFLMDYANSQRIKIWGRARVVDNDPDLMQRLVVPGYRARPERAIVVQVEAWDVNCPQHIPALHDEATIRLVTQKLSQRVAALEAENAELKQWIGKE